MYPIVNNFTHRREADTEREKKKPQKHLDVVSFSLMTETGTRYIYFPCQSNWMGGAGSVCPQRVKEAGQQLSKIYTPVEVGSELAWRIKL